jgi:uncharacterized membrane protein YdfJ with MMPL/SSD domain
VARARVGRRAALGHVLFLLLRSLLLPLKAVLMNLLSIGAAYGVVVAVFQWGWLDWTGYDSPGYIDTIVPVSCSRSPSVSRWTTRSFC